LIEMSEAVNIPQLRFPEFREEWKIVKLTDIVDVMTDYVAAGSFESLRNNVTVYDKPNYAIYLRLTDLRKGIYHKDLKYVDRSSYDFLNKSNLCGGEILMANIGANVGDTYLMPVIDDFATIAPNMIVIKENRLEFLSAFLFYWLNTRKGEKSINTAISGSGQPKINKTDLKQIKISLTSQLEQAKIASFLTAVDNKIEQLSKKQELLGEYKKGVMQQIFSQVTRFKADDGSEFPDWEEKKFDDIFNISAGGDINKSNTNPIQNEKYKYPVYANSGKNKGLYSYSDIYKQDEDCVTVTGRGALGLAVARYDKFYPIVRLLVLRGKQELNIKFFEEAINLVRIYNESTGVPQLTAPQFKSYKTSYPCLPEQTKIANFLSSIDSRIEQVGKQLDESKQFKKALLQQMFV